MSETKTKKRNIRKRRHSSDSDDNDSEGETPESLKFQDIRELQRQRDRPNGVNAVGLALGKKILKAEIHENDPFKMKRGGIVDMKALKSKPLKGEVAEAIGTSFAAETNRRDEDTEMLRYVEEELRRKKGSEKTSEQEEKRPMNQNEMLYAVPDRLKVAKHKGTEDMLSNQMLSGIPEIDLGIEAKIKNIEATEEAKQKLIRDRLSKKEVVSDFVPTNMAVNFMQHNRFNIEDTAPILKKEALPKPKPVRVGDVLPDRSSDFRNQKSEKATDDFHFEKFRKQMRRF